MCLISCLFFLSPHFYLFPSNSIVPTLPSSDTNRHHCTHINTSKNRHLDHYITHPTIFIFFTYILLVSLFLQDYSHGYWWNLELGSMWSRKYERNQKKDERWNYGQYMSCNSPSFLPHLLLPHRPTKADLT